MGSRASVDQRHAAQHQVARVAHVAHGNAGRSSWLHQRQPRQIVPANGVARPRLAVRRLTMLDIRCPHAFRGFLPGPQLELAALACTVDHADHANPLPVGQRRRSLQMAEQTQFSRLKPVDGRQRDCFARCNVRAQFQIVVDAVAPHVESLVGDDVLNVEQTQQTAGGHGGQLLAQPAVRIQRLARRKERLQVNIPPQRQDAAVVSIHRRQPPEQRQIGRDDLL